MRNNALAGFYGQVCELNIYTGVQPTTGDSDPTGTLLCTIPTIYFMAAANGALALETAYAPFQAEAVANGDAGWARLSCPAINQSLDGTCGTSGQQFNFSSTTIITGGTVTLQNCPISIPGG